MNIGGQASGIGASGSAASNLVFSGTSSGLVYRGSTINGALTLGSRSATTDRLFTMSGAGATLSSTVADNNAIVWSNTGAIVHGTNANRTLTLTGTSTGDNTFNPQLTDSTGFVTSLSKTAAGQWNLGNSNNAYTGVTTVANGILALNLDGALPSNSPLVLGTTTTSGILQMSGSLQRDLAATATAGVGTITWGGTTGGGGFAAHATPLTVTLNGGAGLIWGSGGFVPTGASLIFNSVSALSDVTFTNSIDLGTANRTLTINDNGNTGADYATVSGVLSGAGGGLLKSGAGVLRVGNANTYTGITQVQGGTLVVSSLGSSTGGATSSVGASGGAMGDTNAIQLGAGGNNAGILQYVGPGETSDRKIRFNSTTGTSSTNQIHADGSGPLILTNVANDMAAGAKTVALRGSNAAGNMITSVLADNDGALSVNVDGGATWILTNGANNYTGTTTVGGGALGIGHNTAIGAALTISNGNVFAYGADRTIGNAVTLANNAANGWLGDYSLTVNGVTNMAAGAQNVTTTNSIVAGEALTFNGGVTANALTALRAWIIDGPGETVINGNFTTSTAFGVRLDVNGGGTLTLGTNGATSNFNQTSTAVDVDRGTLKFTANNAIPTFGAATPTTTATVTASTTIPVTSTAGLTVGQQFSVGGTVVGRIASIDSGTQFTANVVQTIVASSTLTFAASGGLTISPEIATADTATVDLNGTTQTVNALTANTNGTLILDNTSADAATFRFGANNAAVDFGSGIGSYTITDSGAGALSIVKLGTTSTTFSAGLNLTYQGTTRVEGGSLTIASPVDGTSALEVINSGSTLSLTGGMTSPSAVTSVIVEDGGTLSLLDGAGNKLNSLTNLQLGSTGGTMTTLNFNVGDNTLGDGLNTDTLTLLTGGTLSLFAGNQITFNLTDAGLNANQQYVLLDATAIGGGFLGGPLSIADYILGGTPGGFTSINLTANSTTNQIILSTGNLITGKSWWSAGGTLDSWSDVANWSVDATPPTPSGGKAGTNPAASIPGQGTDVVFIADNITGGAAVTTTLEQNFKINSLTLEASTNPANTPSSVTIAPGAVATNRLEIAPQMATDGISITAGGPSSVTISAPFRLGADQTWNVADAVNLSDATFATASTTVTVADTTGLQPGMLVVGAGIPAGATVASVTNGTSFVLSAQTTAAGTSIGLAASSTLTLSGGLQGEAAVTKTGAGRVILTGAADPTFNGGQTSVFTVTGGNLEMTNTAALGTAANSNLANVTINTGGAFYFNGAASTIANALTLNGGTLSSGTANQIYSGAVNISGDSFINLRDSNSSVLTTTPRAVTLSGPLSGAGDITLDSINTVGTGNQITGDLVISNSGNSGWSGDLIVRSGTVTARTGNGDALGSGAINIELGKVEWEGAGGVTYNLNKALTIARSGGNAVGEWNIDRTSGTGAFTVNNAGTLTLGGAGGTGELRIFLSDADGSVANFTGPVVLANNAAIHVRDNATLAVATISGVISESGGARSLIVNGPAGGGTAWGGTAGILRLDAANTYTGGTVLASGTLLMNHVAALSSGALSVTGASTLSSLVDLTGLDALANALNLSAILAFTGANSITFSGTTTNIGAGGITNSLTSGDLLFNQVNLAESGASAARTLTIAGASTGITTINSLLNNDQNSVLTNNLSAGTLSIGTIALSESAGTGRTLTLGGTGSTTVNGVIENITGGGGMAGSLTKAGTGTLQLDVANTYTGGTTLSAGRLRFGHKDAISTGTLTVSGTSIVAASTPLTGVNAITNAVALNGNLSFDGANSLELAGAVTINAAARTITVNGDAGATFTLSGAITNLATADGSALILAGNATGTGIISGGFTMTGTTADATVSGGTWTLSGAQSTVADDFVVSGVGTVLNLNATGVVRLLSGGTGADLTIRSGGVVNINALNAVQYTGSNYRLFVGQGADGANATLNLNANLQSGRFILGERGLTRVGIINGTGTLTVDNAAADFIQLYRGEINANIASNGTGAGILRKLGSGTVTLRGDNSGLTNTGANQIDDGTLILDFTQNNAAKLNTARALDMQGARLQILGSNSAATLQTVASFTMATGAGNNIIDVTAGTGQTATLALGAITRATSAGTLRINLNNAGAAVTTNTANTNGIVGLAAHTTVKDTTGTWFGTNSTNLAGGSIVGLASTLENSVGAWTAGAHISDFGSGYTGTISANHLSSLRFDAAGGSALNFAPGGVLTIASGGILVTDQVTSGSPGIFGGTLGSGVSEIIVTQDSSQTFEISSSIGVNNAFTKSGSGTVLLSGNSFSAGTVSVQNGTLRISGGNAVGDTALVTLASNRNSTLQLLADETIGRIAGGQRNTNSDYGVVDIGAFTLTLNQTAASTFSGRFAGTGDLVKTGASAFTYNGTDAPVGFTGTLSINQGLTVLSGAAANQFAGISSVTLTGSTSSLRLDNDQTNAVGNRINSSASVILNSTAGTTANDLGLHMRRTAGTTTGTQTLGQLLLNSGHNTVAANGTSTDRIARILFSNATPLARDNFSTLLFLVQNMNNTTGQRGRISFSAAPVGAIGGGGSGASSTTISILPYMVGENTGGTAPSGATHFGNSFVFFDGTDMRALDLTNQYVVDETDYNALGAGVLTNNIRFTATPGAALASDTTGINSLVLDHATGITVTGPAQGLQITSGAILSASAGANVIDGFTTLTTGAGNPYYIYVTNPAGSLTLATTTLSSAEALVKSGAGTLVLGANNGVTSVYLNQGILELSDLDNIGGNSGGLVFAGGTLRLGVGLMDDISTRNISFLIGGATIDTNGINLSLANAIGNSGEGGLTKIGAGSLTLGAGAAYSGDTRVQNGSLIINSGAIMPTAGGLTLGSGTDSGIVQLGDSAMGTLAWTVTSLATSGTGTDNAIVGGGAAGTVLTVNQNTTTTYAGNLGGVGTNENNLGIIKSGVGSLTLSGTTLSYTGVTTVNGGTLNITGSSGAALATAGVTVAAGSTLNLINAAGQAIDVGSGVLSLGATGSGVTVLGLELGSTSAYDSINTSGAASATGGILFNLTGLTGFGAGSYDLLTAASGLESATYSIGSLTGSLAGFILSLTTDPSGTFVRLGSAASTGDLYWQGGINNSWLGNVGVNTNFTTDAAGLVNANGTPGAANTVIFSAQNATGPLITTSLDGLFAINDLQFIANPVGVTNITIAAGMGGMLTINPAMATAGISVADNAGAVTISAPLVLEGNQTWDVVGTGANGSSLTVSGIISGVGTLTKTGDGTLTLSAVNTYSGATMLDGGVLQAGVANGFSASSAYVIGASGTLRLNNVAAAIGSLAGSGIVENGASATAARVLTVGGDNTSTTFSGTLQNGGGFGLGLTKVGTGTLTLSGSNTFSGATIVRNGVLAISGSTNTGAGGILVGDIAGARGRLFVQTGADLTSADIDFGGNATGAGAGYQSGSNVVITGADATNRFALGNVAGGYGYYALSGGTLSSFRLTAAGNNFAGATGVYVQSGGTMNVATWSVIGHGSGNALVDISGGTYNAGGSFALNHVANAYSVVNVRGTGVLNRTAGNISLMQGNANSVNNVGVINLMSGGTIRTNTGGIVVGAGTGSSGNVSLLNFNGGTLVTNAASTTLVGVFNNAGHTASSGAYIFAGGLTIDTNGFNSTLPAALLAPTGEGVATIDVADGGSGYIGAPLIKIAGGGGVGATAVANMVDDGTGNGTFEIGSITITNPGTGYQSTDVLTLTFGDNAGVYTTQATLGSVMFNGGNTSGGLTKTGTGVLTLSGINTYTGVTTINAGTLALGVNDVLADGGTVLVNGGVFDINTRTETVSGVTLQSGSITGSTGVLTSTSTFDLQDGSATAILAGAVGANKTTLGTVVLSGSNTFTGAVSVSAGTLAFSASNNLGDGSSSNTITVNGGVLSYEGAGVVDLGVTRGALVIGSNDATLNAASSTGALTVSGGLDGSSGGDLIKTGSGSAIIGGSPVNLNGGAVMVNAGLLSVGFTNTGASSVTVSGSGTLHLVDNTATTLNLGAGSLNLADGSRLGFELGTAGMPGSSDLITLSGAASVAGTITLDFFNLGTLGAGTYNILQAASGLDAANYVLGNAPIGFNYTINKSGNLVSISTEVLIARYWKGLGDGSWSTVNAGPNFNWSSLADGSDDSATVPGVGQTVIFSAANATGPSITTTLDGVFTIDSLQFLNVPSGVTDVTINPGTGGSLSITPASSTNGILVAANGGVVTIAAPLTIGAAQAWNVNGTGTSSLSITGDVTFSHLVTKIGAGALTLSGMNTGAGGVTINGGTLNINSAAALGTGVFSIGAGATLDNSTGGALTLSTDNAQNWNGSFTFTGTQNLNLGFGQVTLGGDITVSTLANTLAIGGVNDGSSTFALTKDGAGTLTINGSSELGALNVNAGTVNLNTNNTFNGGVTLTLGALNINHAAALGSQTFTINGGTIDNTSGGAIISSTNNAMAWNGSFTFAGGSSLDLGTGGVSLGSSMAVTVSAGTLTVGGVIDDGAETFNLTKQGNGILALNGQSTYGGTTTIQTGTVNLGVDDALPTGTLLTVGAGATAATLNLGSFSQTVASLSATANTASVSSIVIASGETLTVNGNVSLSNNTDNAQTNMTLSGGGALVVNGALFTVGNNTTGANNSSRATLNLSALSSFTATLSGNLTVQLTGDLDASHISSLILSNTANTITAAALTVGASASGGVQIMTLGAGTNMVNANTINLGTGGRDGGSVTFGGNSTGSVVIRNAAGTGRAAFNMGTGGATTGGVTSNNFNVTGHDADLLLGAANIGTQAARTGALTNVFSFDQGLLDMTSLTMGSKTAAGNSTNTLNLGGGTVVIGTTSGTAATLASNTNTGAVSSIINVTDGTVTIGGTGAGQALIMGNSNTSTGSTSTALNISGGSVTLATTGATAVTLANAAAGTATAQINVTGSGTLTVQGNIVRGTGAGTRNATVTLNGGTLDMTGKNIGASGNEVVLSAQAGTLKNLNQLNGGGALTKTTTGLLILEGTNTYTGATDVNAGILQVGTAGAGQSGSGTVTVASGATLAGTGMVVGNTIIRSGAVLQAGDVTMAGNAASTLTSNGALIFTAADTALTVQDGGQIRIGVSSPTLDNTVINFANGVFTFNGTEYSTAKDLFDNEATALTLWNVAPASQANHDYINLTGMGSTLSIGNRISGTFGDGSVLVGGMLGSVQAGQVFNLIDWSGAAITGNFDVGGFNRYDATNNVIAGDLDLMSLGAGFGYDVSAFTTYGIVVIVPEPSRALLLLFGLFGLMLRRRRR
jgi:autotransporter-associated beta strand protein